MNEKLYKQPRKNNENDLKQHKLYKFDNVKYLTRNTTCKDDEQNDEKRQNFV